MCSRSLHCPFSLEIETPAIPEVYVLPLAESCVEHLKTFVLSRNVKLDSSIKPISETKYIVTVGETPDLAAPVTGELAPCAWGSGLWFVLCTALLVAASLGSEFPASHCYRFSAPRWYQMRRLQSPKLLFLFRLR
jgi:hypothetical protein